jgi:hypothetical protein
VFDIPQSCSLTDAELRARRDAFAKLPLLDERTEGGATLLRYADEPGAEATLRELVRLEAECCPGIDFSLMKDGGALVLRIAG